jgi:ankyrin repeat protein
MDFFELVGTGTPQSVQAAINQGADVNARDMYERTPLMLATEYNQNPEVIITLLDAGADVNARDNYVETPLMWAARFNQNPGGDHHAPDGWRGREGEKQSGENGF